MYRIIKDGSVIALTDELRFIRQHENGCFVPTDEENAQGLVISGTPYNLLGCEPMDGVIDTVGYSRVNGGEYLLHQQSAIDGLILTILEG